MSYVFKFFIFMVVSFSFLEAKRLRSASRCFIFIKILKMFDSLQNMPMNLQGSSIGISMALFETNVPKLKDKRDIKGLIKALNSRSMQVQTDAARALGNLYARDAVDPLIIALTNWNPDLQITAAVALGEIGSPKAIKPLLFALKEKNTELREKVVEALGKIGFDAIDPLIKLLNEDNPKIEDQILVVLVELGDVARRPLKRLLSDHNFERRIVLLKYLEKSADNEAIDILIDFLNDSEYEMRQAAAASLVNLGPVAVPKLLETAKSPDSDLMLMIYLLSKSGDERCFKFFKENLSNSDVHIRRSAATGLDNIKWVPSKDDNGVWYRIAKQQWNYIVAMGPVAIGPLSRVLEDKNEKIRKSALQALGKIGTTGLDSLLKSLENPRAEVRLHATAALGKLGEHDAVPSLNKCLADPDPRVRRTAVESLGMIGAGSCINPIIMALKDDDPQVRSLAIKNLDLFDDPRKLDLFLAMLSDTSKSVSDQLMETLVNKGDEVLDPLIDALEEQNPIVKINAATCLGYFGDKRAVPALIPLLSNMIWSVRRSAAFALGKLTDRRSVLPLAKLLKDDKEEVCIAAAQALSKIGIMALSTLLPLLIGRKKNKFAVLSLKEMGNIAISPLLELLKQDDAQIRRAAVKVLDLIGWKPEKNELGASYWIAKQDWAKSAEIGEPAVDPLITVLDDPEMWNRIEAAAHLGKIGDYKAVDSLVLSLGDKYWKVRDTAAKALIKMGRKGVEPLINAMLTGNKESYVKIVETLAEIGDRRAVKPLVYVLKDKRSFVRENAAKALEKMNALEGERRCGHCGKIAHKTLVEGDLCPFCNHKLHFKQSEVSDIS